MLVFSVGENQEIHVRPKAVFCIGDSGRTAEGREAHLTELEKNGIKRMCKGDPPMEFFPVSPILLTQEKSIDVLGEHTTGEVEYVLFYWKNELYITLGSDHADRILEAIHSSFSKQICAKPVADVAWKYSDISSHWDRICLELKVIKDGSECFAQIGAVAFLSSIDVIIDEIKKRGLPHEDGCFYFSGTILLENSMFHFGEACLLRMTDPVLNREIEWEYKVNIMKSEVQYTCI
ncbi:DUF2848 family protein [Clostridium sp. AM58-1XD]|uniref:DUF2848 family protein n=1 Tax=Clostridium sp. AM58-1XD TaxID=2292307 RepID=UPI001FA8F9DB|nr:DUF2848 family protein [Clostridium sp. AM58-1XD]